MANLISRCTVVIVVARDVGPLSVRNTTIPDATATVAGKTNSDMVARKIPVVHATVIFVSGKKRSNELGTDVFVLLVVPAACAAQDLKRS